MKSINKLFFLPLLLFAIAPAAFGDGVVLYSSIPNPLPVNVVSWAYEAQASDEFGGLIQFAGSSSSYALGNVTVLMSNWSPNSDFPAMTGPGYYVPLTLNLYNVGPGGSVGSLINTDTISAFIPWRPAATPACGSNYLGSDGYCHGGSLAPVLFDLTGVTVPDQVIYSVALNTQHYGTPPVGTNGPYNSLNFGLSTTDPTVGADPLPAGTVYLETQNTGPFQQIAGFGTYTGTIEFDAPAESAATPEPSSLLLLGSGLLGMAAFLFRKARHSSHS